MGKSMPANITQACDGTIAKLEKITFVLSKMKHSLQRLRRLPVPAPAAAGLIEALSNFEKGLELSETFQSLQTLNATFADIEENLKHLKHRGR